MSQVFIYDTTLRDGAQREEISLSVDDKLSIARRLDEFGIHYIEGGWPGSNPKDAEFFERVQGLGLQQARVAAFGSTRRKDSNCRNDRNLQALVAAETSVVTLVGKSWDFHVDKVLQTTEQENLAMIGDSIAYLRNLGREVIFDAEHFFDGYYANPEYALATLRAAEKAGVNWLILCETNGGRLPWEVEAAVEAARRIVDIPLGIHAHNDGGCAVANSVSAVRAGCSQVQGTINGYGERVGNANLITIIPNLQLKMDRSVVGHEQLQGLTRLSRFVAEAVNLKPDEHAPYVGRSAFAHKGGIHVAAMLKAADAYQHTEPELVGNEMRAVVSELSGRGNLVYQARSHGLEIDEREAKEVLRQLKKLEHKGFSFEAADASVDLLLHRICDGYQAPFELIDFMVITEHRKGRGLLSEATVKVQVGEEVKLTAAEGVGPVNALALALRQGLQTEYPQLRSLRLADYKVRILDGDKGTAAITRVLITFHDGTRSWTTVGASANIIEASWRALFDAMEYALLAQPEAEDALQS